MLVLGHEAIEPDRGHERDRHHVGGQVLDQEAEEVLAEAKLLLLLILGGLDLDLDLDVALVEDLVEVDLLGCGWHRGRVPQKPTNSVSRASGDDATPTAL